MPKGAPFGPFSSRAVPASFPSLGTCVVTSSSSAPETQPLPVNCKPHVSMSTCAVHLASETGASTGSGRRDTSGLGSTGAGETLSASFTPRKCARPKIRKTNGGAQVQGRAEKIE